jgi:hypothetical protein
MKIGILTQPLHNNYGGLLQAYALQTVLKRLGHDPLILDRNYSQPSFLRTLLGSVKRFTLKYAMGKSDIEVFPFRPSIEQMETISKETSKFVRQYINKSEKLCSANELKREVETHQFDAYVVGSDQVWRLDYSPCITNYFLDFVEGDSSAKRIAYAASFGVDYWHYNDETTRKCKALAQQFDAISVREDSGIDLCRKYLGVKSVQVLDPTMLLDPDDYRALAQAEGEPQSAGNLMTYVLDPSEEKTAMIQRVASTLGLKPFTVMSPQKLNPETQTCIEEGVFPPVTRWLRGYMDAKFVIADSFHGCVFAILFNIPFIALGNQRRGGARFVSLLRQFNLTNRLNDSSTELIDELIHEPIDWSRVNRQIYILKDFSIDFLQSNL